MLEKIEGAIQRNWQHWVQKTSKTKNTTQKTKNMCTGVHPPKTGGITQFLHLIRHSQFYSYNQYMLDTTIAAQITKIRHDASCIIFCSSTLPRCSMCFIPWPTPRNCQWGAVKNEILPQSRWF